MKYQLIFACVLISCICTVYGLECYTCIQQDNNKDKCIKTVKQCEQNQDVCMTNVSWGIPPYWTPHGDRIYKISKDCDTSNRCQKARYDMRFRCKRDWYNDWDCIECCFGDMCNFYATLSAPSFSLSIFTCLLSLLLVHTVKALLLS